MGPQFGYISTAGVPILGTFFGPGFGHHFRAQACWVWAGTTGCARTTSDEQTKRGNKKSALSTASAASSMGLCGRHPNRNPKKRRIFAAHLRQCRCRFRSTFGGTMLATGNCRPSFSGKACVAHWRSYLAMTCPTNALSDLTIFDLMQNLHSWLTNVVSSYAYHIGNTCYCGHGTIKQPPFIGSFVHLH